MTVQDIIWICIFSAVLLLLLVGSIIKRKHMKGWNLAAVILVALSVLCVMSRRILLVCMYKRIEAVPSEAFSTISRTNVLQQTLSLLSVSFLLGALIMLYVAQRQKITRKQS